MQHPLSKRRFDRTNKNDYVKQIAQQEARERFMRRLFSRSIEDRPEIANSDIKRSVRQESSTGESRSRRSTRPRDTGVEALPYTNPEDHHHIAASERDVIELGSWLDRHRSDPACKVSFRFCACRVTVDLIILFRTSTLASRTICMPVYWV